MTKVKKSKPFSIAARTRKIEKLTDNGLNTNQIQNKLKGTRYATRRQTIQQIRREHVPIQPGENEKWTHHPTNSSKPTAKSKKQMKLIGDYRKGKQVKKNIESFSKIRRQLDKKEAFGECIRHAQFQLGGSGWTLTKVISMEYVRWTVIKKKPYKKPKKPKKSKATK